jgi:hypothetical protein
MTDLYLSDKTLNEVRGAIDNLLHINHVSLSDAYRKHGEEKFSITIKVELEKDGPKDEGAVTMDFKPDKNVKTRRPIDVDNEQLPMFGAEEGSLEDPGD